MNNNRYMTKTAAQLVDAYCFEHGRDCKEDTETTQRLIKKELRRRFDAMLKMMDEPMLADHPERIYEYFTHEYAKN